MQADFWHQRWQEQQIGFHLPEVNPALVQFWPALGVPAGGEVFVPLCGKTLDMLWLREQGYRVLGVELSPLAVEAFFTENHIPVQTSQQGDFTLWETDGIRLLCGDFFALQAGQLAGVAAVYDRASLVALPPQMRQSYVSHFLKICPPVDKLLITLEYDQEKMSGPPFAVNESEVQSLYQGESVQRLQRLDMLGENERFRDRGLDYFNEVVYRLRLAVQKQ